MQCDHATETLIATWESKGVDIARAELQTEVDKRMDVLDRAVTTGEEYEFIDAFVLPSLLLAGLFLDMRLAGIEIVHAGEEGYALIDRSTNQ